MTEYGEKLSDPNKEAINGALETLKEAHKSQDLAAIDAALEAINKAWEGASQEMYAAAQEGGAEPGADAGASAEGGADDVADVEYEEVEEEKK